MLLIRSLFFNIALFSVLIMGLIVGLPIRFAPRRYIFVFWEYFSRVLECITELLAGIHSKIENTEYILDEPAIYAIRHESMWETIMLIHRFKKPIFVLKQELLNIPLFGGMAKRSGAIAVNREDGAKALVSAAQKVSDAIAKGHPVIIFPEGTRVPAGQYVPIKRGIAFFYKKNNCPVVPVVHNSGRCWPRRGFIKRPGLVTVKFLPPIMPGLPQDEFMDQLNNIFQTEVEKLNS